MTKDRVCANILLLSRRTILSGLPVSAAALAFPSDASASTWPTPIAALFREWQRLRREGSRAISDEVLDDLTENMLALEKQIFALPSRTARDLACKVAINDDPSPQDEGNPFWHEIKRLIGGV